MDAGSNGLISTSSTKTATRKRLPTISIPPRAAAAEALLTDPMSPGPMTIPSNFFLDNFTDGSAGGEALSFPQLISSAMASPSPPSLGRWSFLFGDGNGGDWMENSGEEGEVATADRFGNHGNIEKSASSTEKSGFKQNRPSNLVVPVSPLMAAPPAPFSPSFFLNCPGLLSPSLSPIDMSHQQALAQVTTQAVMNQAAGYQVPSSVANPSYTDPLKSHQSSSFNSHRPSMENEAVESIGDANLYRSIGQNHSPLGKLANDGYNWRKYGQKQVKSKFLRSYYKCTHPGCPPVKKKVEHSLDGQITEITYTGDHNHEPLQRGKRAKEAVDTNTAAVPRLSVPQVSNGTTFPLCNLGDHEDSMQATSIQLNGPSDSEESAEGNQRVDEDDDDVEPNPKKRNIEAGIQEQKTVTEPKIIVQTKSKDDRLDDGYRWHKYGQKPVKGNPNPRSYYKCTTAGCSVRKHIERSHTDPTAVITTYEGKHNHDIPAGRGSNKSIDTAVRDRAP